MELIDRYVKQLDNYLRESDSWIARKLAFAESKTGVPRLYLAQAGLVLAVLYLIFGHFAQLICNVIGFVYPALASLDALNSEPGDLKDNKVKLLLTYWIVFGLFNVVEFFSDVILGWIPLYWLLKVAFLIWCLRPTPNNGSVYVYNNLIRPFFLKNKHYIDDAIASAADRLADIAEQTKVDSTKL